MAFTYDPSTDRGRVRLLTGDTLASDYDFEDVEVDAALAFAPSIFAASAALLNALAANRARLARRVTRGGMSDDFTAVARELRETAKSLLTQGADVPLEAVTSPSWDLFSYAKNVVLDREDEVRT